MVRIPDAELAALDQWISEQPEPQPSRPEAIRQLVAHAIEKRAKR